MESHFMSLANIRDGALKKLTGGGGRVAKNALEQNAL